MINSLSRYLNLKALDPRLPEEFNGYYNPEKYRNSQEYTRAGTRFAFVESTFSLVITLVFILAGGFNWLDITIRSWGYSSLANGLIYFGILFVAMDILFLPFSLYATFVIEERFGFNRLSLKLFFLDKVKNYFLTAVLGSVVLGIILYFFEHAGSLAWLYAWLITVGFSVVIQPVYIYFISPLFNKFNPLEEGELKTAIVEYLASVKFPVGEIFIMDGSKRSAHSNAYFAGFGKFKRVVLYDTLLDKHSHDEVVAILAHEVGHYKKKHILKGMILTTLHTGVLFFLISIFLKEPLLFDAFGMTHPSIYTGLIFFMLLFAPIEMLLSFMFNAISRKHEFEADFFAGRTLQDAGSMIESLKKLCVENLGNLTPHPFTTAYKSSHPPVLKRIEALRNIT